MMNITIIQAWKLWLLGNLQPDYMLWGINLFIWGRIGKIVQFIAALAIIAEIIGPDKLRAFGNGLHGAFTINKVKKFFLWESNHWEKV
jgi:hypothetical protein